MEDMGRSSGHGLLEPTYFVNRVDDSGGILPPEIQNDFSIPFVINERC